ncbi:MAG: glycosyltransferase [bacterium]
MKIYWFDKINFNGVSETSRIEMVKELSKLGNDVKLISSNNIFNKSKVTLPQGISVKMLPNIEMKYIGKLTYYFSIFLYTLRLFFSKEVKYIIVQQHIAISMLPISILSKILFKKIFIITDIRSIPVETGGELSQKKHQFSFWINMLVTKYLYNGVSIITVKTKELLFKQFNMGNLKYCIWGSAVNIKLFDPEKYNKEKNNDLIIGYHGVISENRGVEKLLQSLDYIDNQNIKISILGRGPYFDEIKKIASNKEYANRVIVYDSVAYDRVPEVISSFNVGILPFPDLIWWDVSSPLKLYEYLSMEIPVIATDISCHDILKGERFGILINNNNPETIAKAIMEYFDKKESLVSLGKQARQFIVKNHTWEKRAKTMNKFLREL